MVFVTVSETYDLSTKQNKMSLIGIHTPKKDIIMKSYPGLLMNHKFIRIVKQDITLACASMLPLDPSRVGFDDGDVAPQDMFNPILYKAVSNDSMSTLETRLHGLGYNSRDEQIDGQSLIKTDDVTAMDNDFNVYYALLSDREGFKTAHPQQGLSMKGLVPYVFEKYYSVGMNTNHPQSGDGQNDRYPIQYIGGLSVPTLNQAQGFNYSMRGKAHPMPKFNTTYLTNATATGQTGYLANGMGDTTPQSTPFNCQTQMPEIMPVYTAAIIMPPCKQTQIYYRMVVRTTLEFTEVRPITDITAFSQMENLTPYVYASDYDTQSAQMTKTLGMVDAQEANLEKIMEGK